MSFLKQRLEANGIKPTESTDANNGNQQPGENSNGAAPSEGGQPAPDPDLNANNGNGGQPQEGQQSGGQSDEEDIEDARLLKALEKRGIKAASISELNKPASDQHQPKTDEEKRADLEKRQSAVTAFGLSKGKITKNQLDKFAVDSKKDPVDLAFDLFRKDRLAELKSANVPKDNLPTEDELIKEFNEYNHLEYDENDPKRIRREKELTAIADAYLRDTYKTIYDLDKEYDDHENGLQTRTGYNSKLDTAATKIPTELVQSIPDTSDKSGKTVLSYKFKPSQQTVDAIKAKYGSEAMYNSFGKGELSANDLSEAMIAEIKLMEFDRIIAEVAHAHAASVVEKIQKGRRNIIDTPADQGGGTPLTSSPVMKRILDDNKPILQQN